MKKLMSLLKRLEEQIPHAAKSNAAVSQGNVGWHIEHSLLVINTIIETVKKSDADSYKWKFNFARTFIYAVGKIPRGKVKAPASVQPKGEFNIDKLKSDFITAKNNIKALNDLHGNKFFMHPFFGDLNVKPTITFLKIHTKHHLKIINSITK